MVAFERMVRGLYAGSGSTSVKFLYVLILYDAVTILFFVGSLLNCHFWTDFFSKLLQRPLYRAITCRSGRVGMCVKGQSQRCGAPMLPEQSIICIERSDATLTQVIVNAVSAFGVIGAGCRYQRHVGTCSAKFALQWCIDWGQ